mgnify:FL=1
MQGMKDNETLKRSRVPWSSEPSLKEMAQEVGIDFDRLIEGFEEKKADREISEEMGVNEKVIGWLRERFNTRGVHSIVGQD